MGEESVEAVRGEGATSVKIREQVEWYLSNENLSRPDKFLLDKMKELPDGAVPLDVISSFKKMKRFRSTSVIVAALEKSKEVNVVQLADSSWAVQRKIPFNREAAQAKPNDPTKVKAKKVKPTGFEEHWTDPPVDPDTYREERNLYDTSRPLVERIETAIQRYEAKRRFSSMRRDVFLKFLRYGGIDTSPRQFTGGTGIEDLENHTADEIRAMTSTLVVGNDINTGLGEENARWVVDFEGVAKAFLSSKLVEWLPAMDHEFIQQATSMLSNFYNYLLMHDVCPEYTASILAARSVSLLATKELSCISDVTFPGNFNKACSIIFGGYYSTFVAPDEDDGDVGEQPTTITYEQAQIIYENGKSTVKANQGLLEHVNDTQDQVIKIERMGLEVLGIGETSGERKNAISKKGSFQIEPVGALRTRAWLPLSFAQQDHPPGSCKDDADHYTFWVEHEVLRHCFVGMKIETTVTSLSNGIHIFDNVTAAHCSFYTILENELVTRWKVPRWYSREEIEARLQSRHSDQADDLGEAEMEEGSAAQ